MCVAHERSSALAAARAPGLPRYRAGDPLSELEGSSPVRVFVNASSRVCTCTLTLVNENVINHPRLSRSRLRCPGTLLSRASLRERAETRDCVCVSVVCERGASSSSLRQLLYRAIHVLFRRGPAGPPGPGAHPPSHPLSARDISCAWSNCGVCAPESLTLVAHTE